MSTCKRMWTDREIYSMADKKAKERIEAGQTSNAKPLYFHPVICIDNTEKVSLAMIIIDNSPSAYDSWTKVKAKVKQIAESVGDTARIPVTGSFVFEGTNVINRNIDATEAGSVTLYGFDSNGENLYVSITDFTFDNVFDGVNKIN